MRGSFRCAAYGCALALLVAAGARADDVKKPVSSAADLPQFTYPVDGPPSALLDADPATFAAFGAKVGADVDAVLAGYDVHDHATLRDLLEEKLELEVLAGTQDAQVPATVQQLRAVEDKPDARLTGGVLESAIVAARVATGATAGPAFSAAFAQRYAAALAALPWSVVGTSLQEFKSNDEILTPALLLGNLRAKLDPAAATSHALSSRSAALVIESRYYRDVVLPLAAPTIAAIGALASAHAVRKPDIWPAREVTLDPRERLTPVRIAVWDSGCDVRLFRNQLYTDPAPGPFDPHGLAFDVNGFPAHGDLEPLTPAQRRAVPRALALLDGYSDLQQSIDSPAARAVRRTYAALAPADVPAFLHDLTLATYYAHGTHVAGIALRGNPAARLVVDRITFDDKNIPTPPTVALDRRVAADERTEVAYFRARHVRVVNMSWSGQPSDDETILEKNGIGATAAQRKALASRLFAIERSGLYAALKSAPEILFVTVAGNRNSDTGFSDEIPASFGLPNLLVVGAVDQAGEETTFTSDGKDVAVDADGYAVESEVPGGARARLYGTSAAAPAVANLAAKLLALDPALTPEQTIGLIRRGATASRDGRLHDIDPRRSLELLRRMLARG
jgi:subtilisin family serine protease